MSKMNVTFADNSHEEVVESVADESRMRLCIGEVLTMLSYFGWLMIHSNAEDDAEIKTRGCIYLSKNDIEPGTVLFSGDIVSFHLQNDGEGFSANHCRLQKRAVVQAPCIPMHKTDAVDVDACSRVFSRLNRIFKEALDEDETSDTMEESNLIDSTYRHDPFDSGKHQGFAGVAKRLSKLFKSFEDDDDCNSFIDDMPAQQKKDASEAESRPGGFQAVASRLANLFKSFDEDEDFNEFIETDVEIMTKTHMSALSDTSTCDQSSDEEHDEAGSEDVPNAGMGFEEPWKDAISRLSNAFSDDTLDDYQDIDDAAITVKVSLDGCPSEFSGFVSLSARLAKIFQDASDEDDSADDAACYEEPGAAGTDGFTLVGRRLAHIFRDALLEEEEEEDVDAIAAAAEHHAAEDILDDWHPHDVCFVDVNKLGDTKRDRVSSDDSTHDGASSDSDIEVCSGASSDVEDKSSMPGSPAVKCIAEPCGLEAAEDILIMDRSVAC